MTAIELTPWEREWAGHVGSKRHEANLWKRDAKHYDPARMQDNLTASVASACAELAVAKRLNKYWDGSYWSASEHDRFRSNADVGQNTEVRRVRERGNPLPVRKRDVDANRIMALAFAEGPRFDVVEGRRLGASAIHTAVAPGVEDVVAETPLGVTLVQQVSLRDPVIHWW